VSRVRIWIPGTPRTKGSFIPFSTKDGKARMRPSNSAAQDEWALAIRAAATVAMSESKLATPLTGALQAVVHFAILRPKKHYRTGKFCEVLRTDAPRWPEFRSNGDIDKLLRALLDPLEGLVFWDDSQIVNVLTVKDFVGRYDSDYVAGASIELRTLR
jgi:crossover junction endodeoxyribonuclease RusA